MMDSKKRTSWNKGKKMPKRVRYTNGKKNICLLEGVTPPEGYWRGQTSNYPLSSRKRQAEKTAQTKLKRYGTSTYNNSEKNKQTCIARYGVGNVLQLSFIRDRITQTNLERYGVDNLFKDKERIKKSLLDKYGVENISQLTSNKSKVKNAWKDKSLEEISAIVKKRENTNINRYGTTTYSKTPEYIEKLKRTCMERYGVPFYTLSKDLKSSFHTSDSKPNLNFKSILENLTLEYEREYNVGLRRYDFKVGSTLIEINPSITHSSTPGIFFTFKEKDYHYLKTQNALDNNFECITIWDWDDMNKVSSLLVERDTLYARTCKIKLISNIEAIEFLKQYHLQGAINSSICIGIFNKEELVGVMTFGKPRYNKSYQYELLRYCTSKNIVGGAEKMFKFFLKHYNPQSIISYCDRSKFTGKVYNQLNFTILRVSIGKHWYNITTGEHYTDNILRTHGFDRLLGEKYGVYGKGTSNTQLMLDNGFIEIYDCGQITYIWNNTKSL